MRKFVLALAAASLLGAVSAANADDEIKGTIKSIDAAANSVTLADGGVYRLPAGFNAAGLKVGDKVKIKLKGDEVKVKVKGSDQMASEIQKTD
jgi:Cu/Ag efflux protein CusF